MFDVNWPLFSVCCDGTENLVSLLISAFLQAIRYITVMSPTPAGPGKPVSGHELGDKCHG